jgi:peptide/nickel transport system substrate-binding protein
MLPALFRLDAKLRPHPDLVAAWPAAKEITLDPFTVSLRIRAGARWSDGKPITSTDVRFTLDKMRAGPTGARYRFLRDVRLVSARRFDLVFDRPVRRWWALFSVDDMILPAHAFADAWDRAPTVSGGPFAFGGWNPGLSIRLQRNDRYWGERAGAEAIEVIFVPDDEARLQLMSRGDLDLVFEEGESNVGQRSKGRGWTPVEGSLDGSPNASGTWGPSWWELDLNGSRVRDSALAEAVGGAVDRHLSVELFDDSGQVADGIPARFPQAGAKADGLPGLPGPWPPSAVPVAQAKSVLAKAGYKRSGDKLTKSGNPVEILLAFDESQAAANGLARFIHFRLRPLGIHVEIVPLATDRLWNDWLPNGKADAYLMLRRGADAPDTAAYRSDSPSVLNPARADADAAVDRAESAADIARLRKGAVTGLGAAAWTEAQQALISGHLVYPLVRVRSWLVSRGGVVGPQATGCASGPLWNAESWRLSEVS